MSGMHRDDGETIQETDAEWLVVLFVFYSSSNVFLTPLLKINFNIYCLIYFLLFSVLTKLLSILKRHFKMEDNLEKFILKLMIGH